ncbi:hypothetical protein SAMN04490248_11011 [Salinihabitans flavidus]|uniref:DUF302 domain-containing protein n=1 Tax=Salinihabitans flavidus TaxID=569882 RepID=A0A1H8RWV3_9RHOB|nr:DUF302 domain-containing protein [Salinihabitans flavidus]SEO70684.1 hypothetical protein SAMN04490248_11011 [Salinihabitans flavidus]
MKILAAIVTAATLATGAAVAEEARTYTTDTAYEDVAFGVENAITNQGLVIDHVSHVGDMLERTKGDVGSDVTLYLNAKVFTFCSAQVSREVMEADPMNLQYCPYGIFVMQTAENPDETVVGYRVMPEGPMKKVEKMLDEIVQSALEF